MARANNLPAVPHRIEAHRMAVSAGIPPSERMPAALYLCDGRRERAERIASTGLLDVAMKGRCVVLPARVGRRGKW